MSIVAYTGLPGSGKSYSVVEHQILPALRAGRLVVTNLAMKLEEVEKLNLPGELVIFSLETWIAEPVRMHDVVKPGCVLVIDEVWKIWPQGMTVNNTPPQYGQLLAEHRHMVDTQNNSTQIVLLVQDLANIAAFARRLVENTFVSHKLGYLGLSKSYRVDIYYGGVTGCTPNVNKRLRFIAGRYKKEVYALYKSQTMSDSAGGHGDESKVDGRANIFKKPIFLLGCVFAPLCIGWGLWQFNKAFHKMSDSGKGVVSMRDEGGRGSAQRSEADSGRPGSLRASLREVPSSIRVLLDVVDEKHPDHAGVYLADGPRIIRFRESECRRFGRNIQCLYRGAYYDSAGYVEPEAKPPLAVKAEPVVLPVRGPGAG
jgi:Zonular occludens toxin (Zot)